MGYAWIEENTYVSLIDTVRNKTGADVSSLDDVVGSLENIKNSGAYLFSKKETEDGDIIGYATSDDLSKYPDGGWQDGYYWELASKIEFTINGTKYYAAEGMTWEEWIDTGYNTIGVVVFTNSSGDDYVHLNNKLVVGTGNPSGIISNTYIVDGGVYNNTSNEPTPK